MKFTGDLRLERKTRPSSLDGCPMFAQRTLVEKDGAQPLPTLCCCRSLGLRHLERTFAEHCCGPFGTRQTAGSKSLQLLLNVIVDSPY